MLVHGNHRGAFIHQPLPRASADARRRSGHERHAAAEFVSKRVCWEHLRMSLVLAGMKDARIKT